jgi:hypothetical protein
VLRLLLWLLLRLLVVVLRLMLIMLLVVLIVLFRLMLLLTRIVGLGLLRRVGFARLRLIVAVLVTVIGLIAGGAARLLLLEVRLALAQLFLRGGDQAKVMLGVLIIIFGSDRIPGTLRVTGQLKIFLGNVRRGTANFYVLPVGLVHARQWILVVMMMSTPLTVATAHALILSVSHGLLFRNPLGLRRHGCHRCSSLKFIEK